MPQDTGVPKRAAFGAAATSSVLDVLVSDLSGTYNIWFTCGDPTQTFGKRSCISSVCEALCTSVLMQGPAGALWQQEDQGCLTQIMPQDTHILPSGSPSLPQCCQEQAGGLGCSAFWLPLQRGREWSAARGPEWATCEVAGYAGDKCVPLMGTCFSDLL